MFDLSQNVTDVTSDQTSYVFRSWKFLLRDFYTPFLDWKP